MERKRRRWSIETMFRDSKRFASLEGSQCRLDQALVRHIALVFLTFVILQLLRARPDKAVASVKERWQLALVRGVVPGRQNPVPVVPTPAVRPPQVPQPTEPIKLGQRPPN